MLHRIPPRAALALLLAVSAAVPAAGAEEADTDPWQARLAAGAVYQSDASLDGGGDMAAERFFVDASLGRVLNGRWRVSAALGYGEDRYDFSGTSGFGALDPWGKIRELRISVPVQYFASDSWTFYAIPSLRFNAESGASLSDGRSAGLLAGASYRVSETLSIGPGLGVFSELEDDASWFPILLIDWRITDTLSLETGGGFAASRGPGVQLRWRYAPRWQFAFGGRYEKTRFRLDDAGPAPDGIGQDRAVPLFALAEYGVAKDARLTVIAGAEVGADLRLEDASGELVRDSDLSTAPFFGLLLQSEF